MVALTPEFDTHWPTLEREIRGHLHRRLPAAKHWHEVEDMTSRVLEAVWMRAGECRDPRGLACTIARRRAVDVIRSRRAAKRTESLESHDPVSPDSAPLDLLELDEQRAHTAALVPLLPAAVSALPALERRVIKLRYDEEMTFNQIDGRLGLRKGSASAAHARARVALRHLLTACSAAATPFLAAVACVAIAVVTLAFPLSLSPSTAAAVQAAAHAAERSPFGTLSYSPLS